MMEMHVYSIFLYNSFQQQSGRSSSCNLWVAGLNPCSVRLSRVLGQDASPALPADGGQRAQWRRCMTAWPRAAVATLITDCCVKHFGVFGELIKRFTSAGHLPFITLM
ncbi:hypothetical protein ILYODFUR_027563 [Ilyodon furcidens]|uniref:Uncharacterized protein n=1 Tax=Ilyodon furcidens TaxID=33524 RepID=A0ABV0TM96_9TELE